MKKTYLSPNGEGVRAGVSESEFHHIVDTIETMHQMSGVTYEVENAEKSEFALSGALDLSFQGITIRGGIGWKKSTATRYTPKGGDFDE